MLFVAATDSRMASTDQPDVTENRITLTSSELEALEAGSFKVHARNFRPMRETGTTENDYRE